MKFGRSLTCQQQPKLFQHHSLEEYHQKIWEV